MIPHSPPRCPAHEAAVSTQVPRARPETGAASPMDSHLIYRSKYSPQWPPSHGRRFLAAEAAPTGQATGTVRRRKISAVRCPALGRVTVRLPRRAQAARKPAPVRHRRRLFRPPWPKTRGTRSSSSTCLRHHSSRRRCLRCSPSRNRHRCFRPGQSPARRRSGPQRSATQEIGAESFIAHPDALSCDSPHIRLGLVIIL